jgi:hypothetical protein
LSVLIVCRFVATAVVTVCVSSLAASAQVNVLMQHNDPARTGDNLSETILTPANVNSRQFGMLFKHRVDDQIYSQPLVLTDVLVGGGYHDLVFVTTVNNSVYAFDANGLAANDPAATEPLWHVNFGAPANVHDYDFGCLDLDGNIGIIGTPAIDADRHVLYVVSLTKAAGHFEQRLHELDVVTGAEMPQSPTTITAPDFDPLLQNQRPALLLDQGSVYVGYASHCDKGPYHGFLMSFDAATLKQEHVLNLSPGGEGASIWQSGQAPAMDEKGNIYFVTGNGSWNGTSQFSESFVKVDSSLNILDWFTPTNHIHLDQADDDFDSSGAILIPGTQVVIGGGKQGVLYLVDKDKMGHLGDEQSLQRFQITGSHIHSIVYWKSAANGRLFYLWGQRDRARVYQFDADNRLETKPFQIRPEANEGHPGGMLSISANGDKDGVLWAAIHSTGDSWHESRPGILHAYDANDINHELWNSLEIPSRDDCGEYAKMAPPTIANGKVYLASFGNKNTGTGQLCVYGLLPAGGRLAAPTNVHVIEHARTITVSWDDVGRPVIYTVQSRREGEWSVVASGLVRPEFTEPKEDGTTRYRVTAMKGKEASTASDETVITIKGKPMQQMKH